jgi:hypothetical protein
MYIFVKKYGIMFLFYHTFLLLSTAFGIMANNFKRRILFYVTQIGILQSSDK